MLLDRLGLREQVECGLSVVGVATECRGGVPVHLDLELVVLDLCVLDVVGHIAAVRLRRQGVGCFLVCDLLALVVGRHRLTQVRGKFALLRLVVGLVLIVILHGARLDGDQYRHRFAAACGAPRGLEFDARHDDHLRLVRLRDQPLDLVQVCLPLRRAAHRRPHLDERLLIRWHGHPGMLQQLARQEVHAAAPTAVAFVIRIDPLELERREPDARRVQVACLHHPEDGVGERMDVALDEMIDGLELALFREDLRRPGHRQRTVVVRPEDDGVLPVVRELPAFDGDRVGVPVHGRA